MQASGLGLSVQNMLEEAPSFLQDSTQGPCPMWALPMPTRDDSSHRPGPGQNADCKQGLDIWVRLVPSAVNQNVENHVDMLSNTISAWLSGLVSTDPKLESQTGVSMLL